MPNISSPLGTNAAAVPLINLTEFGKVAGFAPRYATFAAFTAAVTAERANITASTPVWIDGTDLTIATEPAGVVRYWTASGQHARNFRVGSFYGSVAADANTILINAGVPGGGVGANGDYSLDTAASVLYGPKASGAWPTRPQPLLNGAGTVLKIPLTASRTLAAADMGFLLESNVAGAVALSIDTVANTPGLVWVPGRYFFLGAAHTSAVATTGALTFAALSGVTITNIGTLAVVMDAGPLVVMMSPDLNRWAVQ